MDVKCRSCGGESLSLILDLGHHAWCNDFLDTEDIGLEPTYPLELMFCDDCELLQLSYTVPKEVMFEHHAYVSSTTSTLKRHFLELAIENKRQFDLNKNDIIIDIGGNDGTQLQQYHSIGLTSSFNVESALNIAAISRSVGINTINDYFNKELAERHFSPGSVALINASGIFFHLEELHSVILGIKHCLAEDGVFIVQFMYAGTMAEKLTFDGIYHEHLCYYTLKSLSHLLRPYGLRIFDAYHSEIHSGSIIAKVATDNSEHKETEALKVTEKKDNEYTKEMFSIFAAKTIDSKDRLKDFILEIKGHDPSARIYAYGAPAKGNTLLTYWGITNDMVEKCVEVNELKIGKYLPISHIPIVRESREDMPDYYLLLAHNFTTEIVERYKNSGVKFIIPFPEIKVIAL